MDYNEFKETIVSSVKERLGASFRVFLSDVVKVNGIHMDALIIRSGDNSISPTIYLNWFYDKYNNGSKMEALIQEIIAIYKANVFSGSPDLDFFFDFDSVKENIVFRLVNKKKNEELLSGVPHVEYLDLAVIFYYYIDRKDLPQGYVLIDYGQMEKWEVSCEQLYQEARKNTPCLMAYEMIDFNKAIMDRLDDDEKKVFDIPQTAFPIYILTNDTRSNGAGCILYEKLLERISDELGSSFYILPSSVHETLLVLEDESEEKASYFGNMVREINDTVLCEDDYLSDHVYYYDRSTNELAIAG